MAFSIWMMEKEWNIGCLIDDQFPAMKLFNLWDEYNIKKYEDMHKTDNVKGTPDTMG